MNLPIFQWAKASVEVTALLQKSGFLRFYRFGEADQNVDKPYAVWQLVGGSPENKLAGLPDVDTFGVQVDVYALKAKEVGEVAEALRSALEPHGYVVSWLGESREPDTRLYRFTFRMEFMTQRVVNS